MSVQVTLRPSHSSEAAERAGRPADEVIAIVQRLVDFGRGPVPQVEFVRTGPEAAVRRALRALGYPSSKREVPVK